MISARGSTVLVCMLVSGERLLAAVGSLRLPIQVQMKT